MNQLHANVLYKMQKLLPKRNEIDFEFIKVLKTIRFLLE